MIKSITFVLLLSLLTIGSANWSSEKHDYSPTVSAEVATAIKQELLAHIGRISDSKVRDQLKADLNAETDDERKLKSIPDESAQEIFEILKIDYPNCDKDKNGHVKGDELHCLNLAWKAYVPH